MRHTLLTLPLAQRCIKSAHRHFTDSDQALQVLLEKHYWDGSFRVEWTALQHLKDTKAQVLSNQSRAPNPHTLKPPCWANSMSFAEPLTKCCGEGLFGSTMPANPWFSTQEPDEVRCSILWLKELTDPRTWRRTRPSRTFQVQLLVQSFNKNTGEWDCKMAMFGSAGKWKQRGLRFLDAMTFRQAPSDSVPSHDRP